MPFLFDTNVLSELRRRSPAPQVIRFVSDCPAAESFISVVTITELQFGIQLLDDKPRRGSIQAWLDNDVRSMFPDERQLQLSEGTLLKWRLLLESGRKSGYTYSPPDALIAGTALHHDLTLVTRNGRDFAGAGLRLINPWEE